MKHAESTETPTTPSDTCTGTAWYHLGRSKWFCDECYLEHPGSLPFDTKAHKEVE